MNAGDLTPDQRRQLARALLARRDWLARVIVRMDARGWDRGCPTYQAVENAWGAVHKAVLAVDEPLGEADALGLGWEILKASGAKGRLGRRSDHARGL